MEWKLKISLLKATYQHYRLSQHKKFFFSEEQDNRKRRWRRLQNVVPVSRTFTTWKKSIQFTLMMMVRRKYMDYIHIFYAHQFTSAQSRTHMTKVKRIVNLLSSQEEQEEDQISKKTKAPTSATRKHTILHISFFFPFSEHTPFFLLNKIYHFVWNNIIMLALKMRKFCVLSDARCKHVPLFTFLSLSREEHCNATSSIFSSYKVFLCI